MSDAALKRDLARVLNKYSVDAKLDISDFTLAEFLCQVLSSLKRAKAAGDKFKGKGAK